MSAEPMTLFVVPHTHWDREWYKPLALFQMRLIEVIDAVLDQLKDPRWRRFTLDGQSIILEDYLAIRPEREAEVAALVREGRLRIGPWYVLPDEFLVSPEALVRNLLIGRKSAQRFGSVMKVFYSPDAFGHISQLPLFAAGFGMDSLMFERGVGDEGEELGSEFRWFAADGETEVFAAHLVGTYSGGTALGHASWEYLDEYDPERTRAHIGAALHGVDGPAVPGLPVWFSDALSRVQGGLLGQARSRALVLMNGSDHLFPQPSLLRALDDARAHFKGIRFVLGDVEEYMELARSTAGELARYQGEFRSSRYQHILSGVLSTRLYLKQANHSCETLLERYAEPLAAIAGIDGSGPPDPAFLEMAWRELLENHPHDSICGCSVDPVHREMLTRFERVGQMGTEVCRRAWESLGGSLKANIQDPDALHSGNVAVFNPLPVGRSAVFDHELYVPRGSIASNSAVFDASGKQLPAHLEVEPAMVPGTTSQTLERVSLTVLADLPALGFANVTLGEADAPTEGPVRLVEEASGLSLDNGLVRLTVAEGGAISLHDLAGGEVQRVGLVFEDVADAGDEYDFSPLANSTPLLFSRPARSPGPGPAAGALRRSIRLEYSLAVPARLSEDRQRREGTVNIPLTLDLILEAGSPVIGLRVGFDNKAQDHRLRLLVNTFISSETVFADGHFDVLERPLAPAPLTRWFQGPTGSNHQRRFVAAGDAKRGLAVFNHGLSEYEASEDAAGTVLGVTLVRSTGWLSRDDLRSRPQGAGPAIPTPDAQCQAAITCHLGLFAFQGPWWQSDLLTHAAAFSAPPLPFAGAAPRPAGLFSLDGAAELTSLKPAEDFDGFIIRLSNPSPEPAEAHLSFRESPTAIHVLRLDETRTGRIEPDSRISLPMAPRSVISLQVSMKGGG